MSARRAGLYAITMILTLAVVIHFLIIALHAGPVNPISLRYKAFTDRYTSHLFQQNWHLFAPDPVSHNLRLYVKVRYVKEGDSQLAESEWFDVAAPMLDRNDQTLFSPYNRLVRVHTGYIHHLNLGGKDDLTYRLLSKTEERLGDLKREDVLKEDTTVNRAEEALYRYASSYAYSVFRTERPVMVQFKVGQIAAVPYSKRKDSNHQQIEQQTLYEWREITENVIPIL